MKARTTATRNRRTLTRAQLWTFRFLALLFPVLLFAIVEVFLRMAGYGYPTSFFLEQKQNGRVVLVENRQFGWRFFPKEMARTPQPVVLSKAKESGTIRIVVLGESAAMGDPEPAFGLPRMLQAMLELSYPSNRFEVINVAMTAINSHVIRHIARDCRRLDADAWLIFMGNNEVVGPFGGGTVFGPQSASLPAIRVLLWLKQFRTVQWLYSLTESKAPEWGGMEMFLKQLVRRDEPRMAAVRAHFRKNLEAIVETGFDSGANLFVSTVAVNQKDSPPFASAHSIHDRVTGGVLEQAITAGIALQESSRFTEAHGTLLNAPWKDSTGRPDHFADWYFQLARCELALGNTAAARTNYNHAKEHDALRFRADDALNEAIRACAKVNSERLTFVDAERVFAAASSNGIPGEQFFFEHVHFNFEGNYLLARSFFDALVNRLPQLNRNKAAAPSEELCAQRLGWNEWERLKLYEEVHQRLQQPPFTAQFGHERRRTAWQKRFDELGASFSAEKLQRTAEHYAAAIRSSPADWVLRENYAKFLEANGLVEGALDQWRELMRLLPHEALAYYHVANLLDSAGRSSEALPLFQHALRLNPESIEIRNSLALALAGVGKMDEAERELRRILRLKPQSAEARVNLGQLFSEQGRIDEAMAEYKAALRHDTNNTAAHVNLGKLLNQRGDRSGAIAHYEAAIRINPRHAVAQFNLGNAFSSTDSARAAEHYQKAVEARPSFAEAHLALGLEFAKSGRMVEAEKHLRESLRLQPNSADAHFNLGVLQARAGQFRDAAQSFTRTLQLEPSHPQAAEFLRRVQQR